MNEADDTKIAKKASPKKAAADKDNASNRNVQSEPNAYTADTPSPRTLRAY